MENDRQFRATTNMSAHSAYPTLRKEREGWGTRTLVVGREKRQTFDGLRPVFINPRTLVRTWGTRSELA
jgi:hypothetical protein